MNIDPNQSKISNFDKAINYISKGAEIGKTIVAKTKDSRMESLLRAPCRGENLSIGAKALNLAYLGLFAAPALGSYKATSTIIKHFAKAEKSKIQKDIDSLYKTKVRLEIQNKLSNPNSSKDELTVATQKYEKKLNELSVVNSRLRESPVNSAKENLIMRMNAIEEILDKGSFEETSDNTGLLSLGLSEVMIKELRDKRAQIKEKFITEHKQFIEDFERVLELRNDTNEDIEFSDKDFELSKNTENYLDEQIKNYKLEHENAIADIVNREKDLNGKYDA